MGRRSRHKSAKYRNTIDAARIGLPPTLASVQALQKDKNQKITLMDEALTLHPDLDNANNSQMAFDQAVFKKVAGVTLVRHPYPSEIDLKAMYEEENGIGSSTGILLLLNVSSLLSSQFGMRSKTPSALEPTHPLYEALSKGYCAIIGEHNSNSLFYGLLLQRLPIEVIETGVISI